MTGAVLTRAGRGYEMPTRIALRAEDELRDRATALEAEKLEGQRLHFASHLDALILGEITGFATTWEGLARRLGQVLGARGGIGVLVVVGVALWALWHGHPATTAPASMFAVFGSSKFRLGPIRDAGSAMSERIRAVGGPRGPSGRDFRLLWAGQFVSNIGSAVSTTLIPLYALTALGASAFQAGVLTFVGYAGRIVAGVVAGMVADRRNKRRLLMGLDVIGLGLVASVPLAAAAGVASLAQLYVVNGVNALLGAVFAVTVNAYLPVLVGDGHNALAKANGKFASSLDSAHTLGPVLAGALATAMGSATAVLIDAASFLVSLVALARIRIREPATASPSAAGRSEAWRGVRYLLIHPVHRAMTIWPIVTNALWFAMTTTVPVFYLRTLHASSFDTGLLTAAPMLGGVVGTLLAPRLSRWLGSARPLLISGLLNLSLVLLPLAQPGWGLLLAGIAWASVAVAGRIFGNIASTYQQQAPRALRARVISAYALFIYLGAPMALLAGASVTWLGPRTTLAIAAIAYPAGSLLVLGLSPEVPPKQWTPSWQDLRSCWKDVRHASSQAPVVHGRVQG